jgi:hypothetical protein
MEDPILGTLYNVPVFSHFEHKEESHERSQTNTVGPAQRQPVPPPSGGQRPNMSLDEKKALREDVRLARATATQEARESKSNKKNAEQMLMRIVKMNFNFSKLTAQAAKAMTDEAKAEVAQLRKDLTAMEKTCIALMTSAKQGQALDEKECERILQSAVTWQGTIAACVAGAALKR